MKLRSFWYLLAAQGISALGDAFGLLALEWLVYDLTGSMVAMGTIAMTVGIPEFGVRLFAAPLLDRVNRVRLMALLDSVRCLAFGVPALLAALGVLELWHLFVAAAVLGTCSALFNPSSNWKEAMEGAVFFRKVPALFIIMCFVAIGNMCSVAVGALWVPYVQDVIHADALSLGVLTSITGVGVLSGALLIARLGDVRKRRLAMLGSIIGKGVILVALGSVSQFWAAVPLFLLYGMCGPFFGSFSSAMFGRLVPEELRGRVMSIRLLIGGSLQPVGSGLGGLVAESIGIRGLFFAAGLLQAICALVGFLIPALRGIDGDLSQNTPGEKRERTPASGSPS